MLRPGSILGRIGVSLATISAAALLAMPVIHPDITGALGLEPVPRPRLHGPDYVAPPPHIPVS